MIVIGMLEPHDVPHGKEESLYILPILEVIFLGTFTNIVRNSVMVHETKAYRTCRSKVSSLTEHGVRIVAFSLVRSTCLSLDQPGS